MPTHEDFPHGTTMPADQLGEIVDFVRNTRSRTDPFAVAMEGQSDDDPDSASEQVAAYLETGLTWWVEKLGWWRGDLARNLGRVDAGPPRASP